MAATIQVRRGTASQWTTANPTLAAGEIGFETDTFKIKIGNGSTAWNSLQYAAGGNQFDTNIVFEGATADSYETTVQVTDPTADRTITLPDASGTVVLADGSGNVTVSGNLTVSGTTTTVNSTTIEVQNALVFEGATANAFETTLTTVDPTADRTISLPDATGTVALTGNKLSTFAATSSSELAGVISDETGSGALVFGSSPTLKGPVYLQSGGGAGGSANYIDVNNSTGAVSLTSGYPIGITATGDVTITATGGAAKVGSDTIATLTASQTLSNKTLSSPTVTGTLTAGGAAGTSGQVLSSTGSGVQWSTPAGGAAFSEFMLIGC